MAHIDNLVERIADPTLRDQIAEEIAKLVDRKDFGLVFQRHKPEDVETPGVKPRRGDRVRLRGDTTKREFLVRAARSGVATLLPLDASRHVVADAEPEEHTFEDVVVVKDFDYPIYPGLELVDEVNRGDDKPSHIVINGENYYALETLLYTHAGKVDVIYIDPPYNTGSDDWQYNDRYVDRRDDFAHSKWLSFMERRLHHARRLLKQTGVIFVSISDHEQAHLKLLMEQVFGATNFVDTIVVEMSTTSGPKVTNAQQGTIVKNVEFVHIFRKSTDFDLVRHTPLFDSTPQWDTHYVQWLGDNGELHSLAEVMLANDEVGAEIRRFGLIETTGRNKGKFVVAASMDKLLAVSEVASNFVSENLDRIARLDNLPASCRGMEAPVNGWVQVQADHRTYLLTKLRTGTLNQVYSLRRNFRMSDDYRPRFGRTVIRGDLWKGFYQDMGNVSKEGGVAFANGKKPIRLMSQLIKWANDASDTVILDFFGGSGSTAHAVMEMNAADGGRRQSITVTNNEVGRITSDSLRGAGYLPGDPEWEAEGVFEKVTRPRLKTVVTGQRPDGKHYSKGLAENVSFYKLTYEDENQVALDRRYQAIAPLLWMKSGGRGAVVHRNDAAWALPDDATYGVLFDVAAAHDFGRAVADRVNDVRHVYVVADAESAFQAAIQYLPATLRYSTTRLYSDYLHSFEINGKD
ncbi:site-specific DNA-methyltransferase [Microbacterium sp. OR16]|uniref:site-specific DNA-methyltransferase n=1 Tax=Microbacterium sp. OR16 TaxID=3095345 RepID=UPI0039B63B6E